MFSPEEIRDAPSRLRAAVARRDRTGPVGRAHVRALLRAEDDRASGSSRAPASVRATARPPARELVRAIVEREDADL